MGQKVNDTNSDCGSAQNEFNSELEKIIGQIDLIRKVKMISEDDESIRERDEIIRQKEKKITELDNAIKSLQKEKEAKEPVDNIDFLKKENKKYKSIYFLYLGITLWAVLAFLAYCAKKFLCAAVDAKETISLLIGGILILMILAVMAIIIGKQVKDILVQKKEE